MEENWTSRIFLYAWHDDRYALRSIILSDKLHFQAIFHIGSVSLKMQSPLFALLIVDMLPSTRQKLEL